MYLIKLKFLFMKNKFKYLIRRILKKIKRLFKRYLKKFSYWFDKKLSKINSLVNNNINENIATKPIKIGLCILIIFSCVFFIWGAFAPINSASIAPGKIVINFN